MANFLKSLFVKGVEIDTAGAITGDVLKYDGSKFGAASAGGSAVGVLDDLTDVVITTPKNGELLEFNGTNWVNNVRVGGEPIGHTNKSQSTISFDEGNRRFSIAPVSGSFEVWCKGIKYTKTTTETVDIPDTSGLYYIYYSNTGVLSYRTSYFDWENDTPTAYIYWNEVDNKAYFFADERHGIVLDWQTHEYLHRTRGAAIANGFGANNYILDGNGSLDSHAKIDIADGTFFDEDLQVDITHSNTPTVNTWEQVLQGNAEIPVFYRTNNHWVKDAPTEFPLKQGTSRPQYNLNTAGTWSTTDVQNNYFGVSFIIATNNLNYPIIAVLGQTTYSQKSAAEASFYSDLDLSGFPVVEFRPLYKIIYECKDSYTNTPSAIFVAVTDVRSIVSGGGVPTEPVSDHGSMTGLGDDDHTQYLLADGTRNAALLTVTGALSSSTLTVDSIEIDPTGATSAQALVFNGTKFVPTTAVGPQGPQGDPGPTGATGATGSQGLGYVIGTAELAEEDPESGNWSFKVSSVGAFASGDYVRVEEDSSNYILGTCYAISFFSGSYYMAVAPDVTVGTPDFDPSFSVHLAGETGASGVTVVSDTAPASPVAGNLWFKSDTGNLLIYYDSYWIDASAPNYATLDGGSA